MGLPPPGSSPPPEPIPPGSARRAPRLPTGAGPFRPLPASTTLQTPRGRPGTPPPRQPGPGRSRRAARRSGGRSSSLSLSRSLAAVPRRAGGEGSRGGGRALHSSERQRHGPPEASGTSRHGRPEVPRRANFWRGRRRAAGGRRARPAQPSSARKPGVARPADALRRHFARPSGGGSGSSEGSPARPGVGSSCGRKRQLLQPSMRRLAVEEGEDAHVGAREM